MWKMTQLQLLNYKRHTQCSLHAFNDAATRLIFVLTCPKFLLYRMAEGIIGELWRNGEISEGINSLFGPNPPKALSSAPGIGSLCCAKFSLDMQWYRVEVLQVIDGSCVVFFVDYGNKDTVPLFNPSILTFPPFFVSSSPPSTFYLWLVCTS